MKISINRSQKLKLLKAIILGTLDSSEIFPELNASERVNNPTKDETSELLTNMDFREPFFKNTKY